MDGLRWILLVVGAAIVGAIYLFGSRKEAQARLREQDDEAPGGDRPDSPAVAGEPLDESMERELARLGQLIAEDRQPPPVSGLGADPDVGPQAGSDRRQASDGAAVHGGQPAAGGHEQDQQAVKSAGEGQAVELPDDPEKIVTLLLRGSGTARLHGTDIAAAAEKVGLTFGERGIYHRMMDRSERQVAVFSMANITNPGTFDKQALASTFTPGLCLFMTLPNELSALDSWDAMYAAGQRLADLLECSLLDESGSSLSRQTVAHIRDQMREYDRGHEQQGFDRL